MKLLPQAAGPQGTSELNGRVPSRSAGSMQEKGGSLITVTIGGDFAPIARIESAVIERTRNSGRLSDPERGPAR